MSFSCDPQEVDGVLTIRRIFGQTERVGEDNELAFGAGCIDTTGWEAIWEETPIKKPKAGQNKTYGCYDWEWAMGKWIRKLI